MNTWARLTLAVILCACPLVAAVDQDPQVRAALLVVVNTSVDSAIEMHKGIVSVTPVAQDLDLQAVTLLVSLNAQIYAISLMSVDQAFTDRCKAIEVKARLYLGRSCRDQMKRIRLDYAETNAGYAGQDDAISKSLLQYGQSMIATIDRVTDGK